MEVKQKNNFNNSTLNRQAVNFQANTLKKTWEKNIKGFIFKN